jgi:hypothetical protein
MGLPLQLINGLSDERVRWQDTVENLEHMLDNISGDIRLCGLPRTLHGKELPFCL